MTLAAHRRRRPESSVRCYAVAVVLCLAAVYAAAYVVASVWPGVLG